MSRDDRRALGLLLAFGLLLFGATVPFAGYHLDDFALARLFAGPWNGVCRFFLNYVPGRNLDIAYEAVLHALLGSRPAALHAAGLALDLLNVGLFFLVLRALGAHARWAFAAAALFLVYPNHGETHFWTFAIAQNLIPVTLLLAAALLLKREEGPRFGAALLAFFLALFDYDQAFLMWIPLLLLALLPLRPGLGKRAGAFAAAGLAGNLAHVLFRHLAKVSGGGRPVIMLGRVGPSARSAARSLLAPMVKLPRLEFLPAWAIAGCVLGAAVFVWAARDLEDERDDAVAWRLVLGGLCWTACAYFPNLFWYLSPRHHYLPSAGWLMAGAGAGMLVWPRLGAFPRRIGAAVVALALGLAASFDFAEGRAWAASARLLESLGGELRAGPSADNVFVIGAPAGFGPAPGLANPGEAHFLAGIDGDDVAAHASIAPSAGRTWLCLGCERDLFGDASWRLRPLAGARVLSYEDGRFERAGRLELEPSGLPAVSVPLGEGKGVARLRAPLWLAEAKLVPAAREVSARLEGADLTITWPASGGRDFAFLLALDDEEGRLFEAVDAPKGGRETLWPAYDELLPPASWPKGKSARERWRLRLSRPPSGKTTARVRIFQRAGGGAWPPLRELSIAL